MSIRAKITNVETENLKFKDLPKGAIFIEEDYIPEDYITLCIVLDIECIDEENEPYNAVTLDGELCYFHPNDRVSKYVGDIDLCINPNNFISTKNKEIM